MARYYKRHRSGSPLHWIVGLLLAALLTAALVALGRMAAENLCGGACGVFGGAGGALREPFFIFGDTLSWVMGLAILLGFFLWMAFGSGSYGFSFVLILLLLALGAAMAKGTSQLASLPPARMALEDAFIELRSAVEPDASRSRRSPGAMAPTAGPKPPVTQGMPQGGGTIIINGEAETASPARLERPECPAGNFWNGEGCSPCTVAKTEAAAPALRFVPARVEAAWDYADNRHVTAFGRSGGPLPVGALGFDELAARAEAAADSVEATRGLCAADAVLVLGSASSDGPLARNLDRAQQRADALAEEVSLACGGKTPVYAISLGQSDAGDDEPTDRLVTVLGIEAVPGEAVSPSLIEAELGHALAEGGVESPLLARAGHFPLSRWSWVRGANGPVGISPAARPVETVRRLRPDAPDSCRAALP